MLTGLLLYCLMRKRNRTKPIRFSPESLRRGVGTVSPENQASYLPFGLRKQLFPSIS
jgi:hypothetical protein